jgi:membrane protein implicated in regulation of membrane protease activity
MPISATIEAIDAGRTLGGGLMIVAAMLSGVTSLGIIIMAAEIGEMRRLWWLLLTATMWAWLPFVLYSVYVVGAKVVDRIDETNRVEVIIPKEPEVIERNKLEKP